jgi:hypothetical protein
MRRKFLLTRRKETQKILLSSSELINAPEVVHKNSPRRLPATHRVESGMAS